MKIKNEVIVLGTIHEGHLRHKQYSMLELRSIIMKIKPDMVLAEIPPDRFPLIKSEYQQFQTISDSRMADLPEYEAVILPLADEIIYEIVPVSAWTHEMASFRRERLEEFSRDPARQEDWQRYREAHELVSQLFEQKGKGFDPLWIDSKEYDEILNIELDVFTDLFNSELGGGGLEDINCAHYHLISSALDKLSDSGRRILITFGAGHKGWIRERLSTRNDITLLTLSELP